MDGKPVRKPEHAGTGVLFHFNCELCENSYRSCGFCRGKITQRHGIMATGTIKNPGWTLLWMNPNPSADYESGTVSIDLSGYSYVVVDFAFQLGSVLIRVGSEAKPMCFSWTNNSQYASQYAFLSRYIRVTSTGVVFEVVNQVVLNTSPSITLSTRPDLCKPIRIWGIK